MNRRRGQPIIAWRVEQGPSVAPPTGQRFFARGLPAEAAQPVSAPTFADRVDRELGVAMWQGIRRRLRGQARSLPAPTSAAVDQLVSEVEQALGGGQPWS